MADTNTETSQGIATTVDPAMRNSLPIAFRLWAKSINLNLNVCMPCIVEEYDRKSHQATVRPLTLAMSLQNGERFQRAKFKASVWRWQCGGFLIDSPVFKGETGWVVSSDRNATEVKAGNAKIQSPVSYKNKDASNKGPCEIPDGSEETHVFETGFFIPDKWGDVAFQEEYKDALIIRQQNADGTSNGEAVVMADGSVKIMSHTADDFRVKTESFVSVKDDVITLLRKTGDSEEKVTFSKEGLKYEGGIDKEQEVIVNIRYDANTHQLQKQTVIQSMRGDFIVAVSGISDWTMIDGGQAEPVPVQE